LIEGFEIQTMTTTTHTEADRSNRFASAPLNRIYEGLERKKTADQAGRFLTLGDKA
jgi:hypothetical protein